MTAHTLRATPETTRIGVFNASFPPVLTIAPGDTVEVRVHLRPAQRNAARGQRLRRPAGAEGGIEANREPWLGHIMTGPIAIAGAEPGDTLEVRIDRIEPGADWGYNIIRPLAGTIPEDFHETHLMHIPVDRERMVCRLPWGTELALAPFFGVMGVAPPPAFETITSIAPRIHGGNLDNKELQVGSSLFLPVHVPGANFSVGDGHGVQGDGEVCVSALEMCLNGTFTFQLHKATGQAMLRAGGDADPLRLHGHQRGSRPGDEAGAAGDDRLHLRRTNLAREQAYAFCSLAVDFHVTQTVNGEKGVHGLLKKGLLF